MKNKENLNRYLSNLAVLVTKTHKLGQDLKLYMNIQNHYTITILKNLMMLQKYLK